MEWSTSQKFPELQNNFQKISNLHVSVYECVQGNPLLGRNGDGA